MLPGGDGRDPRWLLLVLGAAVAVLAVALVLLAIALTRVLGGHVL